MKNILGGLSAIRNGFRGFQHNIDDCSILSYRSSVLRDRIGAYMDIEVPSYKEVSEDAARESLIAISYSLPDTVAQSDAEPARLSNTADESAAGMNNSGIEKYMSELMSIASQSPDSATSSPGDSGRP